VLAERAAMTYLALPDTQRDAFADRFHVIDVRDDAVTPANLFAVPPQMSSALLASLRASAMVNAGDHDFSDLMQHGLFLVFSVAIALGRGITKRLVRRLFLDETFRRQTLAPKIQDSALRDSIEHLDEVLPTATRQALVRQFDMHLSTRLGRIWFGLSPDAVARLVPSRPDASVVIGNFGPSLLLSPSLARTQAVNRLIDVLTAAMVTATPVATLLLIEEIGTIVRHTAVARFLLEGLASVETPLDRLLRPGPNERHPQRCSACLASEHALAARVREREGRCLDHAPVSPAPEFGGRAQARLPDRDGDVAPAALLFLAEGTSAAADEDP